MKNIRPPCPICDEKTVILYRTRAAGGNSRMCKRCGWKIGVDMTKFARMWYQDSERVRISEIDIVMTVLMAQDREAESKHDILDTMGDAFVRIIRRSDPNYKYHGEPICMKTLVRAIDRKRKRKNR